MDWAPYSDCRPFITCTWKKHESSFGGSNEARPPKVLRVI